MQHLNLQDIQSHLPRRDPNTHKGQCGHVLIIGGNHGMMGAVSLAGQAAARTGAGLVSIATRQSHAPLISVMRPELMSHAVETLIAFNALAQRATVCVLGPGLGQTPWSTKQFDAGVKVDLPVVVDADGLNLLAKSPIHRSDWILTPHPAEAGRLLHIETSEVQANRESAAQEIQKKYGGVCILKGAGTIVCDAQGELSQIDAGNPGMASGGMGDVLSGVLGGMIAQGMEINLAAKVGAVVHSSAADLAAQEGGERGLLASDLMPYIRRLVNVTRSE